jgi:nitrogen fixation protein FixH
MSIRNFFRLDDAHPFTGLHMLAVVFLFFGTIIAVNVAMVFAATGTFPGLVVKNSYVASQNYNELLAEARLQEQAGWRAELTTRDGVISFRLADEAGRMQHGLDVRAIVGRPSTTMEDRELSLREGTDGYIAAESVATGLWEIDIEALRGETLVYRKRQRLFIRAGRN